jgi:hypothetical protein
MDVRGHLHGGTIDRRSVYVKGCNRGAGSVYGRVSDEDYSMVEEPMPRYAVRRDHHGFNEGEVDRIVAIINRLVALEDEL